MPCSSTLPAKKKGCTWYPKAVHRPSLLLLAPLHLIIIGDVITDSKQANVFELSNISGFTLTPGSPALHYKFCSCLHRKVSVHEYRSFFKHSIKSILRCNESRLAFLHITSESRVSTMKWFWMELHFLWDLIWLALHSFIHYSSSYES